MQPQPASEWRPSEPSTMASRAPATALCFPATLSWCFTCRAPRHKQPSTHTHTLHQLCGPSGTRAIPNFMNQKHTPGFHAGEGGFFPAKDLLIPLHKIPHTTQHQTQGCISSSQDQHKASPAPSHPQHTHTQMHAWGRAKRITTHQCSRHMPSSQPGPLACALSGRGCPPHRIGWLAGSPHSHTAAHTCTSVQQPCC